jgi:hypothetical protein
MIQTLRTGHPETLRMMKHMKSYEGLFESSFMFFIQLVIFFNRTPIGDLSVFGLVISNGECNLIILNN